VTRVSLIDTFHDEKFAALDCPRVVEGLFPVGLETPSSRRGNFFKIIEEVRWELNLHGFDQVKIFVNGNIDEKAIQGLYHLVDAFGVGTNITNAPVVDFSLDIVEVEGKLLSKKGKPLGRKKLLRFPHCFRTKVIPKEKVSTYFDCGAAMESLLLPLIADSDVVADIPNPQEIREYFLNQLQLFSL
jgi:nicotinate phosphoribosyltransferase